MLLGQLYGAVIVSSYAQKSSRISQHLGWYKTDVFTKVKNEILRGQLHGAIIFNDLLGWMKGTTYHRSAG
jgi:hypothetical protein